MRYEERQAQKGCFMVSIIFVCVLALIFLIIQELRATYRWERDIGSYWTLADKQSTIAAKAVYIEKFVVAIEKEKITGYNAVIFKTPDNDVSKNVEALKTLRDRLNEIKNLNPESFAYQTAIQQITAQEQGEAQGMISQIQGCWLLHNGYWYVWNWIGGILICGCVLGIFGAICGWVID